MKEVTTLKIRATLSNNFREVELKIAVPTAELSPTSGEQGFIDNIFAFFEALYKQKELGEMYIEIHSSINGEEEKWNWAKFNKGVAIKVDWAEKDYTQSDNPKPPAHPKWFTQCKPTKTTKTDELFIIGKEVGHHAYLTLSNYDGNLAAKNAALLYYKFFKPYSIRYGKNKFLINGEEETPKPEKK